MGKRSGTYARYAIRNSNASKPVETIERITLDARHTSGNRQCRNKIPIKIEVGSTVRIHHQVTRQTFTPCREIRDMECNNPVTLCKSASPDTRHACGYRYARKTSASVERIIADARNRVRNSHAGNATAT